MEISGVVDVSGQGAIVTGVVKQGILKKGDEVTVIGENVNITTVATSIEMHNKELEEAIPGYSVGIKLRGVERAKKGGDKKKQVSSGIALVSSTVKLISFPGSAFSSLLRVIVPVTSAVPK